MQKMLNKNEKQLAHRCLPTYNNKLRTATGVTMI